MGVETLIQKYEKKVISLQKELDELEYEPCPSGETNDYYIRCDLYMLEIQVLENVIHDLKETLS